jgi:hypothetical protein
VLAVLAATTQELQRTEETATEAVSLSVLSAVAGVHLLVRRTAALAQAAIKVAQVAVASQAKATTVATLRRTQVAVAAVLAVLVRQVLLRQAATVVRQVRMTTQAQRFLIQAAVAVLLP